MAVSGSLNEKLEINGDNLRTNIENGLGNNDFEFTDNGDGSYKVKINSSDRLYYIEENGNIISPENMIEIGTAEELKAFRDEVNSGNTYDGYYISLTSNITLDINEEWEPIGLYLNENASPSDETNLPFSGVFDGNGHEVDGIYISTTDKAQGLFGLINSGKVMNLSIGENCNITGGNATAGVVGYAYNGSVVSDCSNSADINAVFGGGIVGCANVNSTIIDCYNFGTISGENKIGSIAGQVTRDSIVESCYSTGNVIGGYSIGGIVGQVTIGSIIESCYSTSNVIGSYSIGGIVGICTVESIINQCYNSGNIESNGQNENGNSNVGGIAGMTLSTIINCYNTGTVTGAYNNIGGIVGINRGILENSYNTGVVSGSVNYIGGIVGNNDEFYYLDEDATYTGEIYNSYSLEGVASNLYGINNSIIGEECSFKTSTELQGLYTILGSAFVEDDENINSGYPILVWQQ